MDTLLIISLSLLAGIATAGSVWYGWGLIENAIVLRRKLKVEAEIRRLEDEAAVLEESEQDEGAKPGNA
jgi:hypothetical protein